MNPSVTFAVHGLPAPQGSKRHVGKGIMVESSKSVQPWRIDVKHTALSNLPSDWDKNLPMALSIVFRFNRPKFHYGKKGVRPSAPAHNTSARCGDLDKLQRATFDALTGVAFDDDRQVISVNASKRYCAEGEPQGALITVMAIPRD